MPNHKRVVVTGGSPRYATAISFRNTAGGAPAASQRSAEAEPRAFERTVQAGLITGALGYAVAAVFFTVTGIIEGRSSFDIAALLRGTLFLGTPPSADAVIVTGPVFAYNGPRLVTFLLAGVFIAWLASMTERAPRLSLVSFMLLLFVAAPVLGVPTVFERGVQSQLSPWVITTAMTLATLAMGLYLRQVYPALRRVAAASGARS
jgi:hypothetical protein